MEAWAGRRLTVDSWEGDNAKPLHSTNHVTGEFQQTLRDKKVRGMVVKTKVDPNGNVLDPEFEIKDLSEIGTKTWNP